MKILFVVLHVVLWLIVLGLNLYAMKDSIEDQLHQKIDALRSGKEPSKDFVKLVSENINKNSFNINQQDKNGDTLLHKAITKEVAVIVELLLQDQRINVNLKNSKGKSPLFVAIGLSTAHERNKKILFLLVNHRNIQINEPIKNLKVAGSVVNEATPLFLAICNNKLVFAQEIAKKGGILPENFDYGNMIPRGIISGSQAAISLIRMFNGSQLLNFFRQFVEKSEWARPKTDPNSRFTVETDRIAVIQAMQEKIAKLSQEEKAEWNNFLNKTIAWKLDLSEGVINGILLQAQAMMHEQPLDIPSFDLGQTLDDLKTKLEELKINLSELAQKLNELRSNFGIGSGEVIT